MGERREKRTVVAQPVVARQLHTSEGDANEIRRGEGGEGRGGSSGKHAQCNSRMNT